MKKGDNIKVNYIVIGDEDNIKTGMLFIDDIYTYENEKYIEFVDEDNHQFSMTVWRVNDALHSGAFKLM